MLDEKLDIPDDALDELARGYTKEGVSIETYIKGNISAANGYSMLNNEQRIKYRDIVENLNFLVEFSHSEIPRKTAEAVAVKILENINDIVNSNKSNPRCYLNIVRKITEQNAFSDIAFARHDDQFAIAQDLIINSDLFNYNVQYIYRAFQARKNATTDLYLMKKRIWFRKLGFSEKKIKSEIAVAEKKYWENAKEIYSLTMSCIDQLVRENKI